MDIDALALELFDCARILNRGPMKELHALNGGELCVLNYLSSAEGAVTPTALSEEFRISTARVANVLNGLERKGCIQRERCLSDRRRVYIHITEAGRAVARQERENALDGLRNMMAYLGEEDAVAYVRIMKKLVSIVREKEARLLAEGAAGSGPGAARCAAPDSASQSKSEKAPLRQRPGKEG